MTRSQTDLKPISSIHPFCFNPAGKKKSKSQPSQKRTAVSLKKTSDCICALPAPQNLLIAFIPSFHAHVRVKSIAHTYNQSIPGMPALNKPHRWTKRNVWKSQPKNRFPTRLKRIRNRKRLPMMMLYSALCFACPVLPIHFPPKCSLCVVTNIRCVAAGPRGGQIRKIESKITPSPVTVS